MTGPIADDRPLSSFETRPVDWFWEPRIAFGKITIIDGHPGTMKSHVTVALAASQAGTAGAIGEQARNASITGSTYSDTNGNGVADAGEPALGSVTVTLKSGTTTVATATSSAAAGTYTYHCAIHGQAMRGAVVVR